MLEWGMENNAQRLNTPSLPIAHVRVFAQHFSIPGTGYLILKQGARFSVLNRLSFWTESLSKA